MGAMDILDKKFDEQIGQLSEKEQGFMKNVKTFMFSGYNNYIKPILIAIFMFWLFTKIKNTIGWQDTIFVQLTVIIILLRVISSKIH